MHERLSHDDTHVVHRACQRERRERKPEPERIGQREQVSETILVRDAEQNCRHTENGDGQQHRAPGFLHRRTVRDDEHANHRTDGHRVPQPAVTACADMEYVLRKNRQNRHRAAEEHGKHIQRNDAEDDFVLVSKAKAFNQALG